AQRSVQVL
ncbi:AMP-binding enzyme family protein, partial [Vibrio parahaemolyticus V-223/04]